MIQPTQATHTPPVPIPQSDNIRALLLDDSRFDCQRIRRMADKTDLSIALDEVNSISDMDRAVHETAYDLILIDYRLPVGDGMEALDHVLQNTMNRDAAKIMITGDGGVETAVQAIQRGCHDFISKADMNAQMLRTAMMNAIAMARRAAPPMQLDLHEGLVSALQDPRVQENLGALIRHQVNHAGPAAAGAIALMPSDDIELLIAGFQNTDEFIFH